MPTDFDIISQTLTPVYTDEANRKRLTLYICSQDAIAQLPQFQSLERLNIIFDADNIDLSPIAALAPRLKKLVLMDYRGTDISPLRELKGLKRLCLWGCDAVTDLSPIAGLTELEALHMDIAAIDLRPLAGLTNLKTLGLKPGTNWDLSPIAHLTCERVDCD
jgi:hypothetical protein